jgi:Ca2+-transporting ATPase
MRPDLLAPVQAALEDMAVRGRRVIAVAEAKMDHGLPFPSAQTEFDFAFVGLIGLEDPVRPEVPDAITQCHRAGIRVIMITGDYPQTARSIGTQIGLPVHGRLVTGSELETMDDQTLCQAMHQTHIFARVAPAQKLRIVRALQANGEVVAMTGDGVNDAPALKAADIGIAMGKKGTDVAREAAALVLLDDNFASIVAGMRLGRRIFDNLQKAMAYILAIHIPFIGFALLPAFFSVLPLLLLPLHIVFLELIIDPVCSIAFESEQEEKGIMERPPRRRDTPFFGRKRILASVVKGIMLFGMVLLVYLLSVQEGHSDQEVRAIAFSSLVIGNIFLILTQLSETRSFFAVFLEGNRALLIVVVASFGLLVLMLTVPALQVLFGFQFPGYMHFISALSGAAVLLIFLEGWKWMAARRNRGVYRKG